MTTLGTLLRIGWLNLSRDRVAQALTFVLPIIFFSIFAGVFGNQGNDATSRTRVAVVDEDQSAYSRQLVNALQQEGALRVRTTRATEDGVEVPLDRAAAEALIKGGTLPVAIVLPKGIGAAPKFWSDGAANPETVLILADVSDPIAPQLVQGLLQKVSFTAAPEALATDGIRMFEKYSGPLTPAQREAFETWTNNLGAPASGGAATSTSAAAVGLPTEIVNVMQPGGGNTATVSFYAAGIGVMFLLFSCAGAGGTLLEEEESGTLGRLLSSRAGMGGVLLGKWLFIALTGIVQLCVMFLWGWLVFGLPLFAHVPGFLLMTVVTASSAAAFGLVLATASRSRAQLSALSTIIILSMSALGGSMFPRFLMSETMQQYGLVTFNAWALDGYLAVFWRNSPLLALWPQLVVLIGLTLVFLAAARLFAKRWETL